MDVPTKVDATLAATLQTATKIERLTYTASTKVVDPEMQLEKIKKEQNIALKNIIDEERHNEEVREGMSSTINDAEERDRLESIFAEERRRASERIIAATKEHEEAIKTAVLAMMNLGTSGGGSGRK
jgi:trehalose/maltose hydrolase-like predicted phosphorylase